MKTFAVVLLTLLFPLSQLLCATIGPVRGDGVIYAALGDISVAVVDTDVQNPPFEKGCRFIQGAWIKGISVGKGSTCWHPLMESSVFSYHPAFGIPEELVPSIPIKKINGKDSLHLKIGVGKVIRHGKNVFADTVVEVFPWYLGILRNSSNELQLRFTQDYGSTLHGYAFSKTLTLQASGVIRLDCSLANKGKEALALESYLHPFMALESALERYWYAFGNERPFSVTTWQEMAKMPISQVKPVFDLCTSASKVGQWITIGRDDVPDHFFAIQYGDQLKKIRFWSKEDCFSVEPFLSLNIPPGEVRSWSWALLLR